jgi:GT2 family glycosyltransferase
MLLRSADLTLDDLQVFTLGGDVFLAAWDGSDSPADAVEIEVEGQRVERRRATLRLPTLTDAARTFVAFRASGLAAGATVTVAQGKRLLRARFGSDAEANVPVLTSALAEPAQARLVGYVLGVCRGTFRLSESEPFVRFCGRLLQACAHKPAIPFRPEGHLAAGHILYAAGAATEIGGIEAMFSVADRGISELPFRPLAAADGGAARLTLVAPRWTVARGPAILLVGEQGLAAAELPPAGGIPNVASLAEQKKLSTAERQYVLRCLGTMGGDEAAAAARALQILAPEPVRELSSPKHPIGAALEFTASCGDAGVFAQGWIRDRNGLVQEAELVSPFGAQALRSHWRRLPRPDLGKTPGAGADGVSRPGFVALAPIQEPVPVLQHGLRLITAGGTVTTTSPLKVVSDMEARNAVLSAVAANELDPGLLADVIAPATAALHRRVMAGQTAPEIVEIGPVKANPAVSFIIPLYRNLGFLRLQTGAFSVDPEIGRDVELIYVLDSPEQKGELEHLLRGLHVVTGLSFRLVVMGANFGYAAANNTGARAARGNTLMLMNSDVIPLGANWLRSLRTALRLGTAGCRVGAVGPKLIFDDGSLQHAGLTFERDIDGRWYNTHFFKGYPRDWPAANVSRSVPGVTGAAMLIPRAIYEEVGGFSEDYVVGDYEDSDLCLKLRSRGYDIRYEPRAELYHFERRSITLHAGYVGTAASAYNRALHAGRWSDLMAEVTSGEELSAEEPYAEPEASGREPALSGAVG